MVYNKKFVAVIKCNDKILREFDENLVILPFGSEYSILLKNLDHRRSVVNVTIDGTDVLNGTRLVIDANSEIELKGVMIDNAVKNAFKFINKTKKISDHRGDKIDDGMIRIKFGFERPTQWLPNTTIYRSFIADTHNTFYGNSDPVSGGLYGGNQNINCSAEPKAMSNTNESSSITMDWCSAQPQVDEGITVPGSELKQDFTSTYVGTIEDYESIIIRMKGTDDITNLKTPIYVSTKIECPTCGTKSKYGTKYCSDCGTNLQA